ncbi:MAG: amidohydrolase family protein [Victivallaceae bacterium]|nr:amidohydrolase family protein [Victivallaceae bacterium]
MVIDIHAHVRFFRTPADCGPDIPAEDLLQEYDRLGIDKGCLLPIVSPEINMPQTSEEVIAIAAKYPERFIPFCNIDPRSISNSSDAPLGKLLEHYRRAGCRGIGEVTANLDIEDARVVNLFRHAEINQLPLTFHLSSGAGYGLVDRLGLPGLEKALKAFPELKFLGHSRVFWAEIGCLNSPADRNGLPSYPVREGTLPRLFRTCPNLYGDLSAGSGGNALMRDPVYAVKFMNEFQDRLLFGLDICTVNGWIAPLKKFLEEYRNSGKLSRDVYEKIMYKNALNILNL